MGTHQSHSIQFADGFGWQERLIQKLGATANPFSFQLPTTAPTSIILQDGAEDAKSPVGVVYDLLIFVGDNENDKQHKRSSVSMAIRKVQSAPITISTRQPST